MLQREREIVSEVKSRSEQLLAYETELEIGRKIQTNFLPGSVPDVGRLEVATWFEAAREVAGDFLDVFPLRDRPHVAIVVGDVCDKGVGAALFMTLFRSLIRASATFGFVDPEWVGEQSEETECPIGRILLNSIGTTNRYVATTHAGSSMFASVFFGLLDPGSGHLTYINAGHEAPVIFRGGGNREVLEVTGGVLGLFGGAPFGIGTASLEPGDMLLAYSDGVSEAKNPAGEQFGEQRILDAATPPGTGARAFLDDILAQLEAFRGAAVQSDDITMVAVKYLAAEPGDR